jgi:hypothetical protein
MTKKIKMPSTAEIHEATADEVVSVALRFSAKLFAHLKKEHLISGETIESDFKEWQLVFEKALNENGTINDAFERLPNNSWGKLFKELTSAMPPLNAPPCTAADDRRFAERVAERIMKKRGI